MDSLEFLDPFRRLLEAACPPETARAIEAGGDWRGAWEEVAGSGFLDLLVAEEAGGAGLTLAEAAPLLALLGAEAVPLPIGETMIARALLARAGQAAPAGPIVLATDRLPTPLARIAGHALTGSAQAPALVEIAAAEPTGLFNDNDAVLPEAAPALRPLAAVLRAQLIAGALGALLEMTVGYANERSQFGKPVGRQQAVQQQLAVLAEQALAARIAAAIGARAGLEAGLREAAIAKHGASRAAAHAAAIAHAVHGAIGISEEHGLQRLTRRLRIWRLSSGSEGYWARQLGEAMAAGIRQQRPLARMVVGLD